MKYIDGFRSLDAAAPLRQSLAELGAHVTARRGPVRLMEVCGSHTMAIARFGIRDFLPEGVELVSGPGCPVCVTEPGFLDAAIDLAHRGVIVATFGDLLRVPGSRSDLARTRAAGGWIEVCQSPHRARELARDHPDREVVFLAVGFETTIAPIAAMLAGARRDGLDTLSLLTAFKLIPPVLAALAADPDLRIDGLLCPAHVSAIIGPETYGFLAADHGIACVVAGFEPLDILYGLEGLLRQLVDEAPRVDNQYSRVVKPGGNPRAQALMAACLEPVTAAWRGLGPIPGSGLGLRPELARYDAARRHGLTVRAGEVHPQCRCGAILKGLLSPDQCGLFGRTCHPEHPLGPCMVSQEGSCAAHFRYGRRSRQP
ncbi:MAG: hydrogenase formation protein HypD [Magnetococcales bacterium]|nr:hydrogenase formation protein HypD [Magnetococcales bacterium]